MPLDPEELRRYGRHLVLPEVGLAGQERLRAASALVVGAGGLGSPIALYLTAAGVGRIGLVDDDTVELSNLQRQVLYGTADVGHFKTDAARARLGDVNPHVELVLHPTRLDRDNALALLRDYDVILDGTDNFSTRYLVNDACVFLGKPNVYGSIFRFEGQVAVFDARVGPCYRCLYPEPPPPGEVPNCAEGGVLGVLPGIVGSLQAAEALKLLLGAGESLVGRLLLVDVLAMRFRELRLRRDPNCPVCSANATRRELPQDADACAATPVAGSPGPEDELTVTELRARMDSATPPRLLDVRTHEEWAIARIDGALHLPLHELSRRAAELDPGATWVVYCHVGGRSAAAVAYLRQRGFARAINLKGGIDAWSRQIDPSTPRY